MQTNTAIASTLVPPGTRYAVSGSYFRMKYGKASIEVDLGGTPEQMDQARRCIALVIDKMKRRSHASVSVFPDVVDPTAPSLTLSQATKEYLENLADREKSKNTLKAYSATLEILLGVAGDMPVASIDHKVIGKFYKNLRWWPHRARSFRHLRDLSPREILEYGIAQAKPQKIATATEDRHTAGLNAFFETLLTIGQVPRNPMALAKRDRCGQQTPKIKSRRPFTHDELGQIFNPSTYVPWASKFPHTWWIPQIALMTGARVDEIAQLRAADIGMDNGAMCFFFKPVGDDYQVEGMRERTFKNGFSMRIVPVAKPLLDAGLLTFVEEVKAAGLVRLFPQLKAGVDRTTGELNGNGYSIRHIQQFGDYLREYTSIKKGTSTHAFRHLITTALTALDVPDMVIASITGHAPSKSKFVHLDGYKDKQPEELLRPKQVAALTKYNPGIVLPRYTPGQFAHCLGPTAKKYP